MGGTALSVLSPLPGEWVEPLLVEAMVAEGLTRHPGDPDHWRSAAGHPYGYYVQPPDTEVTSEELALLERAAGAGMRCDIVLEILVSDIAGRRTLAMLAQRVAERADGWVFVEFSGPPSPDLLRRVLGVGRHVRVGDELFLDAVATRAWIDHPDFYVVK